MHVGVSYEKRDKRWRARLPDGSSRSWTFARHGAEAKALAEAWLREEIAKEKPTQPRVSLTISPRPKIKKGNAKDSQCKKAQVVNKRAVVKAKGKHQTAATAERKKSKDGEGIEVKSNPGRVDEMGSSCTGVSQDARNLTMSPSLGEQFSAGSIHSSALAQKASVLRYLPIAFHGCEVLKKEGDNSYRADNSQLKATAPGIGYRVFKRLQDKDVSRTLLWGDTIIADDCGDGWVRCEVEIAPLVSSPTSPDTRCKFHRAAATRERAFDTRMACIGSRAIVALDTPSEARTKSMDEDERSTAYVTSDANQSASHPVHSPPQDTPPTDRTSGGITVDTSQSAIPQNAGSQAVEPIVDLTHVRNMLAARQAQGNSAAGEMASSAVCKQWPEDREKVHTHEAATTCREAAAALQEAAAQLLTFASAGIFGQPS